MRFLLRTTLLVSAFATAMAANAQQIQVVVNGSQVEFVGQGPTMVGDRLLVPLRGVLEKMGARVLWDPATQTVTARRDRTRVKLAIGQNTAAVNGHPVNLDVPAQIINGSTMVPLRFVGEALGETVHWDASTNTVDIELPLDTHDPLHEGHEPRDEHEGHPQPPPPPVIEPAIFPTGTVFPVTLNVPLNSDRNHRGDRFYVTVNRNGTGLPKGTRIEGFVEGVRRRSSDKPGMIELRFDRISMRDGDNYPIDASLIDLGEKNVEHRGKRFYAKTTAQNNRAVFAGVGAGAGLIVGLATKKPVQDTAIGGLLGLLAGSIDTKRTNDVHLQSGTLFGIRLNNELTIQSNDIERN